MNTSGRIEFTKDAGNSVLDLSLADGKALTAV